MIITHLIKACVFCRTVRKLSIYWGIPLKQTRLSQPQQPVSTHRVTLLEDSSMVSIHRAILQGDRTKRIRVVRWNEQKTPTLMFRQYSMLLIHWISGRSSRFFKVCPFSRVDFVRLSSVACMVPHSWHHPGSLSSFSLLHIISFTRLSCCKMCPSHLFFQVRLVCNRVLVSWQGQGSAQ